MGFTTTIDLGPVAHGLSLSLASVETVVRLLDGGNTVPFITRYRKDQTGGLNEEHIRHIEARVSKLRLLAERKQTILRSIDSQGKLTPELAKAINDAESTKRLEDLYLPFKPKKQTLATLARERQLEPLAAEILGAAPAALDLDARARDFVNPDKQVMTPADALLGVGHILAEDFSERADLRDRLRRILKRSGKLVSTRIELEEKDKKPAEPRGTIGAESGQTPTPEVPTPATTPLADGVGEDVSVAATMKPITSEVGTPGGELGPGQDATKAPEEQPEILVPRTELVEGAGAEPAQAEATVAHEASEPTAITAPDTTPLAEPAPPIAAEHAPAEASSITAGEAGTSGGQPNVSAPPRNGKQAALSRKEALKREREAKKARKEDQLVHEFRDYFNYHEQLGRIPPHRVLAINRGERARVLRVKIDSDTAEMMRVAEEMLVPKDHPHAEFLRGCARDALQRLVIPSLEREVRRELTENAEIHAVEVFAKNLRNLLLQPPVRNRRVMAIDPGFKSGCKIAVLDEFGSLLDQALVHIIGRAERKQEGRAKLVELIRTHSVKVLAIGNGTACRETEEFIAEILASDFKDDGLAYVIVNEAGASVYSTSPLGREELPQYDATLRGAISIGRRLQDPLSELVKIDPASIGVGLYQHDVKAKHLRASLDAVVESCVNYVGVDLNTASPALLRYVSGLNQLTARRVYDYRTTNGPFQNREQLKQVPGFGEAAFVQSAGFLKIAHGDNPLDATWIHPESYDVARKVLQRIARSPEDLSNKEMTAQLAEQVKSLDLVALAQELEVGQLTLFDIVAQFTRPGRDPREDLPEPIFKRGILKLDDLQQGMELSGSVLNVVDFGAFVDIGLHDSGLVHVSQLANRFVRDPHEVVSVGDIVKVWVLEIDKTRRRVSLTMIPPGTKKPEPPWKRAKERKAQAAQAGAAEGAPGPAAAQQRPALGDRPPRQDRPPREGRPPRPAPAQAGGARPQGQPPQGAPGQRGGQPGAGQPRGGGQRFGAPGQRRGAPPPHMRGYGQQRPAAPTGPEFKPKGPPKPPPKLTKDQIEGKKPMRTFGDLAQFMKIKQTGPAVEEEKPKQKERPKPAQGEAQESAPAAVPAPPPPVPTAGETPPGTPPVAPPPPSAPPAAVTAEPAGEAHGQ